MANKKYEVRCDGRFLGHYHGTTPEGAVNKAVAANVEYHPWIENGELTATKNGSDIYSFYWDEVKGVN